MGNDREEYEKVLMGGDVEEETEEDDMEEGATIDPCIASSEDSPVRVTV